MQTWRAFFGELDGEVIEYDDSLIRSLIERITVYDDRFTVEFKSGIEVDVALKSRPLRNTPPGASFYIMDLEIGGSL